MGETLKQEPILETKWDELTDVGFRSSNNANVQRSLSNSEKIERSLRSNLLDASETFSRQKHAAYSNLAENLTRSGYGSLIDPIESLDDKTAKIDTRRIGHLVDYIDQRFAAPDDASRHAAESIKEEYLKDTRFCAETIADSTGKISRELVQTEDKRLEGVIHYISKVKEDAPDGQIRLAKAYFKYFDEPSDESKRYLMNQVANYSALLRQELGNVSDEIARNHLGNKELPGASFIVGRSLSRGYEELHDAIMKYYNHKSAHSDMDANSTTSPSEQGQAVSTDNTSRSSSSLPTDIF